MIKCSSDHHSCVTGITIWVSKLNFTYTASLLAPNKKLATQTAPIRNFGLWCLLCTQTGLINSTPILNFFTKVKL